MQVGEVWVLDIWVALLQVVAKLHGRIGGINTLGAVVHLHPLVFPRVENVLPDVLRTVGPMGDKNRQKVFLFGTKLAFTLLP